MKTLLISQGGCGTNWLKYRYGPAKMCAGLPDTNPHQRLPYCPPDTKILYLQAHPIGQLLSYERREFFERNQAIKNLGGNEIAFRGIHPNGLQGGSLESYANLGINCFLWAEHRKGWQTYALQNEVEIMFVTWESLEDARHLKYLDNWVCGNNTPLHHHAKWNPRNSTAENLGISDEVIGKLKEIHKADIHDFDFVTQTIGNPLAL